jgi:acylpyruvate hydrolase
MRLVTFETGNEVRLGALRDNSVIDLEVAIGLLRGDTLGNESHPELQEAADTVLAPGGAPRDMLEVLARGEGWCRGLAVIVGAAAAFPEPARLPRGLFTPLGSVRLRAPLLRPGKIVCVGLNYESHRAEQGIQTPARPIFFLKSNNTICGQGDPIVLPPNSQQVDFEAEFAVVIGKRGKAIPEDKVLERIAGYTILNDVSARDLQIGDKGRAATPSRPWARASSPRMRFPIRTRCPSRSPSTGRRCRIPIPTT